MILFHLTEKLFVTLPSQFNHHFYKIEFELTIRFATPCKLFNSFSYFHTSPDYITHHAFRFRCPPLRMRLHPTSISAVVVERSPIQSFAADCPIHLLFNHRTYTYFIVMLWQNDSKGFPAIQGDTLYSFDI